MLKHNLPNRMRILTGITVVALVAGCNNGSGNHPAPRGAAPVPEAAPPIAEGENVPAAARDGSRSEKSRKSSARLWTRPSIRSTSLRLFPESRSSRWLKRRESRSRPTPSRRSCPPRGPTRPTLIRSIRLNRLPVRQAGASPGRKPPTGRRLVAKRLTARQAITIEKAIIRRPSHKTSDHKKSDRRMRGSQPGRTQNGRQPGRGGGELRRE